MLKKLFIIVFFLSFLFSCSRNLGEPSGNMSQETETSASDTRALGAYNTCSGQTVAGATAWVQYSTNGIYTDVNTSACGYTAVPIYTASLGGGSHWTTRGVSSIYSPTAKGFRVYIEQTGITVAQAKTWKWHVNWTAALARNATDLCAGKTIAGSTAWVQYNANGIYTDVNISACGFTTTPIYTTSLGGSSSHWTTRGATSIYSPTAKGFRVYIEQTGITVAQAKTWGWHVNYIASPARNASTLCAGKTVSGSTNWVQYNTNGIYTDINTSACGYAATPIYTASLGGGSHWTTRGISSIYSPTKSGFRVYIEQTGITSSLANSRGWQVNWIGNKISNAPTALTGTLNCYPGYPCSSLPNYPANNDPGSFLVSIGMGLWMDNKNPGRIVFAGWNKPIALGIELKNTVTGSGDGQMIVSKDFLNPSGGLKWTKVKPMSWETFLLGISYVNGTHMTSASSVSYLTARVVKKGKGNIIIFNNEKRVLENGIFYDMTSKSLGTVALKDCNANQVLFEDKVVTYNGISLNYTDIQMCFIAGTKVATQSGLKRIEQIAKGEMVLAKDETTDKLVYKKVLKTTINDTKETVRIKAGKDEIESTPDHPYRAIQEGKERWLSAFALQPGMEVITENGKLKIENVKTIKKQTKVYNIEVEDAKNYFVGDSKILVHNECTIKNPQFDKSATLTLGGGYAVGSLIRTGGFFPPLNQTGAISAGSFPTYLDQAILNGQSAWSTHAGSAYNWWAMGQNMWDFAYAGFKNIPVTWVPQSNGIFSFLEHGAYYIGKGAAFIATPMGAALTLGVGLMTYSSPVY